MAVEKEKDRLKKVSLIVPCYNEEESIVLFDEELCKVIRSLDNYKFEVLYVNDGSSDNTLKRIKELKELRGDWVRYISFSRNFGKEAAMYAGFVNASGDYVAVMDADLQDPPSLLPQMLKILEAGEYDSVATHRSTRKGEPIVRSFFAKAFYRIINKISDADIVDGARDFRLMKRDMVDVIVSMTENSRFSKGIFGWIGFRTYWLAYDNVERVAGQTKWNFWRLFIYSIEGIINFSRMPLTIASYCGLFCTLLSFIAIAVIVIRKILFGDPVQGWASTVCVVLFIGGIQLFCMGILGQYLGRVYSETKNRPHYIASDVSDEQIHKIG